MMMFFLEMTGQNLGSYELLAKYWKLDTQKKGKKTLFYQILSPNFVKFHLWILLPLCDMILFVQQMTAFFISIPVFRVFEQSKSLDLISQVTPQAHLGVLHHDLFSCGR